MQKTVHEKRWERFSAGQQFGDRGGDVTRFVPEVGEGQTRAKQRCERPHAGVAIDDTRMHIAF